MAIRLDEATLKEIGEVAAKESLAERILRERNLLAEIADTVQLGFDRPPHSDSTALQEKLQRLLNEWHGNAPICPGCNRR